MAEGEKMIRRGLILVCAVWLVGCGGGGSGAPAAVVRDSAGVTIVENVFPDSTDVAWWMVDPAPVLDIGGVDAEEASAVFRVADALRLTDGRVVAINGADVRYFSASGAHLRTTGRQGDGPGEFQRPRLLLALPGDSVLVVDGRRASVLDPEGSFARDFVLGGTGGSVTTIGRLADGSFIATAGALGGGDLANGFQRPDVMLVGLTLDGAVRDTIVTVPGTEGVLRMQSSGGEITSITVMRPPFIRRTVYAAAGDGLVVATQETPEVRMFGGDGALLRIVRTGIPMPVVTEEHLEAWYQRQREAMPEELRAQSSERPEWEHAGTVVPPYESLEFDDAGNLWIADYDDRIRTPNTWSVHDAEGRLLARIRLPRGFRPLHIGNDFVVGVERDDLDVEHVRMYRIRIEP
jgi:hypothetical protein